MFEHFNNKHLLAQIGLEGGFSTLMLWPVPTGPHKFLKASALKTEFQISKKAGLEKQGKKVFLPAFLTLALQAKEKKKRERKTRSFLNQALSNRRVYDLLPLGETRPYSLMAEGIILTYDWVRKELTGQMFLLLHLDSTTIYDHSSLRRIKIYVHPL